MNRNLFLKTASLSAGVLFTPILWDKLLANNEAPINIRDYFKWDNEDVI